MPTSTEVAGISIGISADIGGLDASLTRASSKVENWARRTSERKVNVTVEAKKGDSWANIENEFKSLIERVTQGQKVPVTVDFDVNPRQLNELYAKLYNTIRTEVGTRKIPVEVDYKANVEVEAKAHVEVTWSWADGSGPPGDLNVQVGNQQRTTTTGTTTPTRRRSARGAGETETSTASAESPVQENFGQRMARQRRERNAATAQQAPAEPVEPTATITRTRTRRPRQQPATVSPTTATVEEVSGIAAMGTGTPRNAAQRQRDKVIADNTAVHRAETNATREWVRVNQKRAREIAGEGASFRRGASGFTAEMVEGQPTGQVKYKAGGQAYHFIPEGTRPQPGRGERQRHAPIPESQQRQPLPKTTEDDLIESILAIVSPEQGAAFTGLGVVPTSLPAATRKKLQTRVNQAIAGQMQRREQRATRTPTGADWRSMRWFNDPSSGVDPADRRAAEDAFQAEMSANEEAEWQRLRDVFGATDEEREKIIHNWAGKRTQQSGRTVSEFGTEGIKKMAAMLGGVLDFHADEVDESLQQAAELITEGDLTRAREVLLPIRLQTRHAILEKLGGAKGQQRAARLRGGAGKTGTTVLPRTPEETAYMAATALQQQIEQREAWARQDDIRAGGAEKAKETRAGKKQAAARAAYIAEFGPPPEAPKGQRFVQDIDAAGNTFDVTDIPMPEEIEYQGQLKDYWADFRDFEKEYKVPKAEKKATGTGTRGPSPATAGLSARNLETQAMAEHLGALQASGDEEALPEVMDLEAELRDIARRERLGGDIYGSRRQTTAEKGLTGPHRRASQAVRANIGFCEYCGTPFTRGHADHPISRAQGGAQAPIGGPEHLVAACETCNNLKGDQSTLEWLQNPNRPSFATVDPRQARAHQEEMHPERMWNEDVLGLRGSNLRSRIQRGRIDPETGYEIDPNYDPREELPTTLRAWNEQGRREAQPFVPVWRRRQGIVKDLTGSAAELEALPTEVPDVRDIAEALGMGRGGFQQGRPRRAIASGVLQKLRRQTKGADVEKAAYLVGESYVDEYGRQLDVITEAVMAEAEATAQGFRTTPAAAERVKRRLRAGPRRRILGAYHGIEGHGLRLSEPGNAAVPEQNDRDFLLAQAAMDPNFISMVGDPSASAFPAAFGATGGQVGQRKYNVVQNPSAVLRGVTPIARVNPVQANADQIDMGRLRDDIVGAWENATDDMRARWTETFVNNPEIGPLPDVMQQWANARASGAPPDEFDPIAHWDAAIGGAAGVNAPLPVRWRMGAAGAAAQPGIQPGPNVAQVAARAAAMGAGGAGVPPGAAGGFGFGGGPAGPIVPPGGVPAGPAGNPGLNKGLFNRSYAAIRQDLLRTDVPEKKIEAIEDQYELDYISTLNFINTQQTELQNALAATPVRALSTAVGQFVAQRFARGKAQAAQRKANLLIRQQGRAAQDVLTFGQREEGTFQLLQQERATGISQVTGQPLTRDDIKNRQRELAFFRRRRTVAQSEVQGFVPRIKDAVAEAAPLSRQLLNLAALTPAIVAGGVIFQAAMQAAQMGLEALGKVAGEGAEAGTGFNQTMRRVQDELAQAAMERGDVRGVVAQRFMGAGLEGTAQQRALLEGRIGAVTATNRFIEQRDLLRSLENIRSNAPGAARFGIDTALVRPTGGIFGTAIGAQQSLDEIIGNELERLNPNGLAGMFNLLNETAPFTGTPFGDDFQLFGKTQGGLDREKAQRDFAANLNRELGTVGNRAQFATGDLGLFGSPERQAQAAALDMLGANEIAAAVRAGAYEIRDANGEIITAQEELAGVIKDLGKALQQPSGAEFRRANERAVESALIGIQDQFRNTRTDSRVDFFRNFAVNRPLPFGTGFNSGDAASQAAMDAFGPAARRARTSIGFRAMQGRQDAINLGVDPADLDRLTAYGTEIANIRADLAGRQLELSGKAYNQQLLVAKRNLSDLRGLTGQIGAGTSAVGRAEAENLALQRENVQISRGMQERQMALTQGQINYNLAVSKFSGGGASAAEAYAKQEQAQIEAEFAQRNLDDQRRIFANEGRINTNTIMVVDEQNLRGLQDAIFAVNQIEESHALEKYSAAAEQYMDLVAMERQGLEAEVDAQISRGRSVRDLGLESARKEFEATGEYLLDVTDDIGKAFQSIQEDYERWLSDLPLSGLGGRRTLGQYDPRNMGGTPMPTGTAGTPNTVIAAAGGALFSTSGPQNMIVGETNRETVAVLRNPRMMSFGEGGGGVVININNPVVRQDSDIDRIALAVEQALNQRTSLLGLRR